MLTSLGLISRVYLTSSPRIPGEYFTSPWTRWGLTDRTSIWGGAGSAYVYVVLARLGIPIPRGARSLSGDIERYFEDLEEGLMMTGSSIVYRAVTLGEVPRLGISGVVGLESVDSYLSRSLDERGGMVSWAILLRLGSSRLDDSRFGRWKAVAEAVREEKSEGRMEDL